MADAAAQALGRKRQASMTPEERSAHARHMAEARWGKPAKKPRGKKAKMKLAVRV